MSAGERHGGPTTWIRRERLASWSYRLPGRTDEGEAPDELRRLVVATLRALAPVLAPVARVRGVELLPVAARGPVLVRADGAHGPELLLADVDAAIARAAELDLYAIQLDLDLRCRTPAGSEWIDGAATVDLFVAPELLGDRAADREWPLLLDLDLHVDVFARCTGAAQSDNRELAALNAPALAALLAGLESELGASLLLVDAEGYPGAGERGLD